MAKLKWSNVKEDDKPSQTQKPEFQTEVSLKQFAQSTKKGHDLQRFLNRALPKFNRANKTKTERGDGKSKGRTHHCAECKKPYSALCRAKGHMVPCEYHPENNTLPGKPCAECKNYVDAQKRNERKNTEEEEKRADKFKETAWFKDDKQRKKPGMKEGRGSYKGLPRPEDPEAIRRAEEAELRREVDAIRPVANLR